MNYAPGIVAQKSAIAQDYAQNLWLHGPEHYLTEVCFLACHGLTISLNITQVGTMNMFVVFKTKDNGQSFIATACLHDLIRFINCTAIELVTPPLDGMILPGVTRDSVLALARDHASGVKRLANLPDKLIVSERPVTMKEVKEASQSGSLVELFGAGNIVCFLTRLLAADNLVLLQVPLPSSAQWIKLDTWVRMYSSQRGKMGWAPSLDLSGSSWLVYRLVLFPATGVCSSRNK